MIISFLPAFSTSPYIRNIAHKIVYLREEGFGVFGSTFSSLFNTLTDDATSVLVTRIKTIICFKKFFFQVQVEKKAE